MRLKVGDRYWKVELEDQLEDGCMGETNLTESKIVIKRGLTDQEHASTLFHEILHAASPSTSEATVEKLEQLVFPLLWRDGWRPRSLWRIK